MSEVTRILSAIEQGDPHAAEQLLPLVYDELRKLAAQRLLQEKPGQTLQATALVHDAYLRLVANSGRHASPGRLASPNRQASPGRKSGEKAQHWDSRGHFFAAAAEAMRRILIENARRKRSHKHGGGRARQVLDPDLIAGPDAAEDLLALDEALTKLETTEPQVAALVKLRYFAGLTIPQAAEHLAIAPRTADAWWAYAKAWFQAELRDS